MTQKIGRKSYSVSGGINIVKTSVLSKVIYRLNVILIKISVALLQKQKKKKKHLNSYGIIKVS